MFEIGLSGQMFDGLSVYDHLEAAKRCGYSCVELRSTHIKPEVPRQELQKIRSAMVAKGLYASCLSCFIGNYGLMSDAECEQAFDLFTQYIELACFFDAEMIRIWPGWQESAFAPQTVWEKAARWMKASAQYARQSNKKLVMEMHHGTLCDTAAASVQLLEMIAETNVGVTLDPVNLYQVPTDYGENAIRTLGAHLFNVHIKDIIELQSDDYPFSFPYSYYAEHIGRFTKVIPPQDLKKERFYCHRRINAGGVDWSHVLKSLQSCGYGGRLVVESVSETNLHMPSGVELAKACFRDISDLFEALD